MKFSIALLILPLIADAATPVTVASVADLAILAEQHAPATVVPQNAPSLAAEISARIEAMPVRVGDKVSAGDTMARLDCRLYRSRADGARAQLRELEARRRYASSQLSRARNLQENHSVSEETLDLRRSDLSSLAALVSAQEQAIVQADIHTDQCEVTAPFAAVVTARLAAVGDLAAPGTPLLKLTQLDNLEISAELRSSETEALAQANAVWFAYEGKRYPAQLRSVVPVVDARQHTLEARLTFVSTAAPAGAGGRLVWQDAHTRLPAALLVRREDRLGVFRVAAGKAHFQPLAGAREGEPARAALAPDTLIVVDGRQRIVDQDDVEIIATTGGT